jgi:hypothetical protein
VRVTRRYPRRWGISRDSKSALVVNIAVLQSPPAVEVEAGFSVRATRRWHVDSQEIKGRLNQSIEDLISGNSDLLRFDANERTITGRLAAHMSDHFGGWNVDCEYNRIGKVKRQKLIHYSKEAFKEAKKSGAIPGTTTSVEDIPMSKHPTAILPDIIVHRRGEPDANLLIVEVKKANNLEVSLGWDQFKIQFLIDKLHYSAGAFVVLNTEVDSQRWEGLVRSIEWFDGMPWLRRAGR